MEKDKRAGNDQQPHHGGKVVSLPTTCRAEGCKKKLAKADFCQEHYLWFKAGLIKKDGSYPKDFDKKYIQYMRKAS